jgi:TrmH family RNA methyltransferase
LKYISSSDNPSFKALTKLAHSARQRAKSGQTLLEGSHLLAAYLDIGCKPQRILMSSAALNDAEIAVLLKRVPSTPVTRLDDRLFSELSELKTPTGILTLIDVPQPAGMAVSSQFALLLEDIQDPGNLGSTLRSAAAAGCDAVFLSKSCTDAWSPRVLRAGMGGHFTLDIYERQDLHSVARSFTGELFAASLQAERSLFDCDLSGNLAFMIGNEGSGLSAGLRELATQTISIPMPGKTESLNAAAAAAVCLFEAVRQRQQAVGLNAKRRKVKL